MWTGFIRLVVGFAFGLAAWILLKQLPSQNATVGSASFIIGVMATFYINEPRKDDVFYG